MKKNLFGRLTMVMMLAIMAGFAGCNTEDVDFKSPIIEVTPETITIDNQGLPVDVSIKANRKWNIEVIGEAPGSTRWISLSKETGNGNATISVGALPNPGKQRTVQLKITSSSTSNAYVMVTQQANDDIEPDLDPIYSEKTGTTVEKVGTSWPYVDAFVGWTPVGTLDQSGVTYTGTGANVSNSGAAFQPATGSALTGAPYVGMSYSATAPERIFQINDINITGKTNFTFNFSSLFQSGYSGSPAFGPVTNTLYALSASLDNVSWTDLTYTVAADPAGGNWYVCTSMFKAPAASTKLYVKFTISTLAANQGTRTDDFTLTEGGTGTITIGGNAPEPTEPTVTTLAAAAADITTTTATLKGSYSAPAATVFTELGIEYKTGAGSYTAMPAISPVANPISVTISGLTASTAYTFRAYAKATGVATPYYGAEMMFITKDEGGTTDAIYSEKTGTTVEKVGTSWPYVDVFTGWTPVGTLDQTGVTYTGTGANVSNSGAAFQPAAGSALTGAPYVGMSFSATAPERIFQINNINITGKTNFTFKFSSLFQSAYSTSPTFAPITTSTYALSASLDNVSWTDLTYTVAADPVGGNWYVCTSMFKAPAASTKLYVKFTISTLANSQGTRTDDFTLTEGGTGTITIGGGAPVGTAVTNAAASAITNTGATVGGSYVLEAGKTATAVGVEYKINGSADAYADVVGTVATPFTVSLSGLTEGTAYTYKAYVTVDGAKIYGTPDLTFTTTGGTDINKTITEVLAAFVHNATVTQGWKISGTVVSDKSGGNFEPKAFALVDALDGITIILPTANDNTYIVGDKLTINLTGGKYIDYNGLKEIEIITLANISKTGTETPVPVTITDPTALSLHLSKLVTVTGAQAVVTTGTMSGTKKFVTGGVEFDVFTKTAATHAASAMPTGKGSITGVVGIYNGVYQIQPRFAADFAGMTGARDGSVGFSAPEFTPTTLTKDAAITNGKISIDYTNNPSAGSLTVSVASSIGGINPVTNMNVTLLQGSGVIEIPIDGTPDAVGTATFTITGITGLVPNTVDVEVLPFGSLTETLVYSTGFESSESFPAGTVYNEAEKLMGPAGQQWGVYFGTSSTTSAITEAQSMQMRWYAATSANLGYAYTDFDLTDVTKVVFNAKNTNKLNVEVSYSDDGGVTWKGEEVITLEASAVEKTYVLNATGVAQARVRFKIALPTPVPTSTSRVCIDDVQIYGLR